MKNKTNTDTPGNSLALFTVIVIAIALLTAGLMTPVATVDRIFVDADTYSILGGLSNLVQQDQYLIAILIFGFSVIFPISKLAGLIVIYVARIKRRDSGINLKLLEVLGKWSMLDVFVIAITFGAANLGILSDVQVHWGIYLYGAGVLLSMIATLAMSWSLTEKSDAARNHRQKSAPADIKLIHLMATTLFIAGISLPLVVVEKWFFWESHYSLISALPALVTAGEWIMPLVLLVLVIALPLLRIAHLAACYWQRSPSGSLIVRTRFTDKWAMVDVYVLAMLVVLIKLNDSAEVQLQPGFWCLCLAALLGWLDSYHFRRDYLHSTSI